MRAWLREAGSPITPGAAQAHHGWGAGDHQKRLPFCSHTHPSASGVKPKPYWGPLAGSSHLMFFSGDSGEIMNGVSQSGQLTTWPCLYLGTRIR